MSNITKGFMYLGSAGAPQLEKELILKDIDAILTDVVMTEIGLGVYTASVPLGSMWNVWDNTTPPGVDLGFILDAGSARTREPAIAPGLATDVFTGAKEFNQITMAMVYGLPDALADEVTLRKGGDALEAQERSIADLYLLGLINNFPESNTVQISGMTCSRRQRSLRHAAVYGLEVPETFDGNVPSTGTWTDILAINSGSVADESLFDPTFDPPDSFRNVLLPGAVTDIGVQLIHLDLPATAGAPNTTLCDFRIAFAPVGINDVVGTYSDWITPASESSQRQTGDTLSAGIYQAWFIPTTAILNTNAGGGFKIKVQAKVKTIGTAIDIGTWRHANIDVILFPKAG
jgi:hypothetical protein